MFIVGHGSSYPVFELVTGVFVNLIKSHGTNESVRVIRFSSYMVRVIRVQLYIYIGKLICISSQVVEVVAFLRLLNKYFYLILYDEHYINISRCNILYYI